jgi:hypothetical protein
VLEAIAGGHIQPERIRSALLPFDSAAETLASAGDKPVYVREPLIAERPCEPAHGEVRA